MSSLRGENVYLTFDLREKTPNKDYKLSSKVYRRIKLKQQVKSGLKVKKIEAPQGKRFSYLQYREDGQRRQIGLLINNNQKCLKAYAKGTKLKNEFIPPFARFASSKYKAQNYKITTIKLHAEPYDFGTSTGKTKYREIKSIQFSKKKSSFTNLIS